MNVHYSLTEIDALSKKATRGAGYNWGVAEEAGKAARLLCGFNLPGAELLAQLLVQNDVVPYASIRPLSTDGIWQANKGPLCPIITGATISDRAYLISAGGAIELERTSYPLLLVPFAMQNNRSIHIEWQGVSIICKAGSIAINGDKDDLHTDATKQVKISMSEVPNRENHTVNCFSPLSHMVDADRWRTLEEFAYRTYAPATAESRAGAGADNIDRD